MRYALALLPVALALAVYHTVTRNYFLADDFLTLYHIRNYDLVRLLLTPHGGHLYVARNLAFFLTHALFGVDPRFYFAVALATHLLNVLLLFRATRLLTKAPALACVGAALWGISPAHRETLGWYSVYGHEMVATALLLVLGDALALANAERAPGRGRRAVWYLLALVAATGFGTGTAIAFVLPFVLWLLPLREVAGWRRPPLLSLVVVVPALYALSVFSHESLIPSEVPQLLSPQALSAAWTAYPSYLAHLATFGLDRLLLGYAFPHAPPFVAGTILLVVVLLATGRLSVRGTIAERRTAAALLLLLAAAYGSIALGRGLFAARAMEFWSTQGRHQYVPELVWTLLVCLLLASLGGQPSRRVSALLVAGWFCFACTTYAVNREPIDHHDSTRDATTRVLRQIDFAIAARAPGETVYVPNRRFAEVPLPRAVFPGWAGVFVVFFPENTVAGRPVRFVEPDRAAREALATGRRTGTLLVAPEDVVSKATSG